MTAHVEIDLARHAAALRRRSEKAPDYDVAAKAALVQEASEARHALREGVRANVATHNPQATPGEVDELADETAARLLDDAYMRLRNGGAR